MPSLFFLRYLQPPEETLILFFREPGQWFWHNLVLTGEPVPDSGTLCTMHLPPEEQDREYHPQAPMLRLTIGNPLKLPNLALTVQMLWP